MDVGEIAGAIAVVILALGGMIAAVIKVIPKASSKPAPDPVEKKSSANGAKTMQIRNAIKELDRLTARYEKTKGDLYEKLEELKEDMSDMKTKVAVLEATIGQALEQNSKALDENSRALQQHYQRGSERS